VCHIPGLGLPKLSVRSSCSYFVVPRPPARPPALALAPIVVYIVYIGQIAEMQRRRRAPCRMTTRSEQRTEPWWIAS
jgi:hypothetical protein